jgi:pSer/pThr/pTyr-binding forkhead associated (FHA) protein
VLPAVVVKTGPEAGRRVELGVEVVIGRQDADLVLEDPEVSRRHAVLRRSGESVVIEDLDSTNGTFVEGERIRKPITVGPGDEVRVGRTTLEIEPDWRAAETVASPALEPDQIRSAEERPSGDRVAEHEDVTTTQPLPSRMLEGGVRPARSNRSWFAVGAVVVLVLLGVIAYARPLDRPAENDFAARANDACTTVQQSGRGVDLGGNPTRRGLEGSRNTRLKALDAIRALEPPEQDAVLGRFLSAFGETNASITRLERAIGAGKRKVAHARRSLRGDVEDERELAAAAGIAGCGGLAIR